MSTDRRKFLKKLAIGASAVSVESILPKEVFSKPFDNVAKGDSVLTRADIIAETQSGKVRGYIHNGIYNFKGIPYGASTDGERRFMPPQKPAPWNGVRNALVYGPISPQKINSGWSQQEYAFLYQWKDGFQSEDCLRLNIWSPGLNDGKKRPVMFWIHGGAFTTGSSQEHPSYDGENVSRMGDVVVVSINHRLNIFGYLDLSEVDTKYASSGNLGMLDIVASLEWVRDNIGNFGGDKNNVTIYGQSGGGTKVLTLMAMPSAKGLFHKAIAQSNSIVQVSTREYAAQQAKHFLTALGLKKETIGEIHKISTLRLIEAGAVAERQMGSSVPKDVGRAGWQPVVDGVILPHHPFDPGAPEISANIPFMVGTTRNEASASIDNATNESLDEEGLKKRINDRFGTKGSIIYEALRKSHPKVKPVEILSFISAQNPIAFLTAERKAAQNAAPVYLYMFSWHTPVLDSRPRAFHCSEIPFVFANTDICETYTGGSGVARQLGSRMAQSWINFAKTGNPNHKGIPQWPSFNAQKGAMMIFDNKCQVKIDPDGEARQTLERIFYNKEV